MAINRGKCLLCAMGLLLPAVSFDAHPEPCGVGLGDELPLFLIIVDLQFYPSRLCCAVKGLSQVYTHILLFCPFRHGLSQETGRGSLGWTGGPCCLSC